ncbi:putative hybrid sensor histidine kinase/response regulator [Paratrimastix pyriformis]|uniref:Hybrid sensor histidine kinase/response regulator n=1 Tax=Paratrimastix pyriformis TaxID=342808 RepID=A0ABQ8UR36_9EUKA|nr:putative hybrid sensor histidine kinase/response regulator [Paratrimastix pyriformis]
MLRVFSYARRHMPGFGYPAGFWTPAPLYGQKPKAVFFFGEGMKDFSLRTLMVLSFVAVLVILVPPFCAAGQFFSASETTFFHNLQHSSVSSHMDPRLAELVSLVDNISSSDAVLSLFGQTQPPDQFPVVQNETILTPERAEQNTPACPCWLFPRIAVGAVHQAVCANITVPLTTNSAAAHWERTSICMGHDFQPAVLYVAPSRAISHTWVGAARSLASFSGVLSIIPDGGGTLILSDDGHVLATTNSTELMLPWGQVGSPLWSRFLGGMRELPANSTGTSLGRVFRDPHTGSLYCGSLSRHAGVAGLGYTVALILPDSFSPFPLWAVISAISTLIGFIPAGIITWRLSRRIDVLVSETQQIVAVNLLGLDSPSNGGATECCGETPGGASPGGGATTKSEEGVSLSPSPSGSSLSTPSLACSPSAWEEPRSSGRSSGGSAHDSIWETSLSIPKPATPPRYLMVPSPICPSTDRSSPSTSVPPPSPSCSADIPSPCLLAVTEITSPLTVPAEAAPAVFDLSSQLPTTTTTAPGRRSWIRELAHLQGAIDKLKAHGHLLAELLEKMPFPLALLRGRDTILYVNPSFQVLLGYSARELPAVRVHPHPLTGGDVSRGMARSRSQSLSPMLRPLSAPASDQENPRPLLAYVAEAPQGVCVAVPSREGPDRYMLLYKFDVGPNEKMLLFEDLTQMLLDQDARTKLTEQLNQAQRMEGLGMLPTATTAPRKPNIIAHPGAGGIAHDFNNLLGGIVGCSELLRDHLQMSPGTPSVSSSPTPVSLTSSPNPGSTPPGEPTALAGPKGSPRSSSPCSAKSGPNPLELVDEIMQAALRAGESVSHLLTYSRRNKKPPALVDVNQIIRSVTGLLRRSLGPTFHLVTNLGAERRQVYGDAAMIQNGLLNLGVNARDAMPRGGVLQYQTHNVALPRSMATNDAATGVDLVALSRRSQTEKPVGAFPADGLIRVLGQATMTYGDYLLVTVRDTGEGIKPDVMRRIFEPFFTTKPAGRGTGLGLSSVLGTFTSLGATIVLQSQVGVGTVFDLFIPLVPGASSPRRSASQPAYRPHTTPVSEPAPLADPVTARDLSHNTSQQSLGGADPPVPGSTLVTSICQLSPHSPTSSGPLSPQLLAVASEEADVWARAEQSHETVFVRSTSSLLSAGPAKPPDPVKPPNGRQELGEITAHLGSTRCMPGVIPLELPPDLSLADLVSPSRRASASLSQASCGDAMCIVSEPTSPTPAPSDMSIERRPSPSLDDSAIPSPRKNCRLHPRNPAAPTVLLVDDEAIVRRVATGYLNRLGFRTVEAANGREAVELFGPDPGRFAAVLLDLTMPEMSGQATFAELRRLRPAVPVLICSGFSDGEVEDLVAAGAHFLAKPYTMAQLKEHLTALLGLILSSPPARRRHRAHTPSPLLESQRAEVE